MLFDGKTRTTAERADSLSFFAAIKDDQLDNLLKESGLNSIFLRPKQEGSVVDSRYNVVWASDRVAAETAIAKLPHHRGLVCSMKGYGVRVKANDAERAFGLLNGQSGPNKLQRSSFTG